MGDTIDHPNFTIVDDFLDEESWTKLWSDYQFMELLPVTRTSGAWKLDDGVPLGGREVTLPRKGGAGKSGVGKAAKQAPADPLSKLMTHLLERQELHERLVDDNWNRLVARPYVYPRETGLSWHVDDHELYAGAFIYYAHPVWNAHWGGELLIGETDGQELPIMGYRFETEAYSAQLLEVGCGNFIMPKPNRLVLLSGAPHMIAKVSSAAGQNVRATVAGFFLRPSKS